MQFYLQLSCKEPNIYADLIEQKGDGFFNRKAGNDCFSFAVNLISPDK